MIARKIIGVLALIFLVALSFGCQKSTTEVSAPTAPQATLMSTIVRIHWLGEKRVSADTNAVGFMKIWNMPQSVKLEAQTLDKLSLAPWRLLRGETNQPSTNLLRPLLEDLVKEESYIEVRGPANSTNAPNEMILAIRLNDQRAGVWQTNLAAVLQSLTGILPANSQSGRWSLKKHHAPNLIEFTRAGEWTILGAAEDHNALLDETLARISRVNVPFPAATTNSWLEASGDLARLASVMNLASDFHAELPKVSLAVQGEAQVVRTHAEAAFPKPLPLNLQPWNMPTNLIGEPLLSFTAVRGVQPWLASLGSWNNLQIGVPPDQFYFWSVQGFPMETYFAAPMTDASNRVSRFADTVLKQAQPWFATNSGLAVFRRSETFNGLEWRGLPYMSPFLKSASDASGEFVFGGFLNSDSAITNPPVPAELVEGLMRRTNLVFYSRENTDTRVQQWLYIGQFIRLVTETHQLQGESTGLLWLQGLGGKIEEDTVTEITQVAPDRLAFDRKSGIGLTAVELHLLADWLESPEFPRGLHTFLAPPEKQVPVVP